MKTDWQPEEFRCLVTLGESTTAGGWSTSPDRCWACVLAASISQFQVSPVKLINVGIGANVISSRSPCYPFSGKPAANERLDQHVISHRPDLLIISYGLNDARGGTPLDLFRAELLDLVGRVRQVINPLIVLLGPYYMWDFSAGGEAWSHASLPLLDRFNDCIADIAHQQGCLYVDVLAAIGETDWMVHHDGVHANDLGHRIIANRIFEVLAQNCSCLARHTKQLEKTSRRWRDESMLTRDFE
jgi:lysophospholipase L1-like esterase